MTEVTYKERKKRKKKKAQCDNLKKKKDCPSFANGSARVLTSFSLFQIIVNISETQESCELVIVMSLRF